MDNTVIVALCSLAGTLGGSILGVIGSTRLTVYRLEQLEKKVDTHNRVIERVVILEQENAHNKEDINELFRRAREYEAQAAQIKTK